MRLIDFKQIKHLWVWYTKNKNKNREESEVYSAACSINVIGT